MFFSAQSFAGIVLGGTRLIYPADKKEIQLPIKNTDNDSSHLVQSWLNDSNNNKAPFIITPPLFKLEAQKETLLHIIYTGKKAALPEDRETLFWLNVKSIAATSDENENKSMLQLAIKSRLKVFWRPEKLSSEAANRAWEDLTFSRMDNRLKVSNPTPYHISIASLSVNGKAIESTDKSKPGAVTMMVMPFASNTYPLPASAGNNVSWSAINDYGGTTATKTHTF
ncbi:molecular chaperone [Enterobacter sp. ENT03]|uniref:fimbrial biogenesis chaperone n=1 Tax=Enterobacter sp. ENT03 TaxID=2854780 RepID=UPI00210D18B2|nr:molecular chaperone [Enterobacter sp. ENT03]